MNTLTLNAKPKIKVLSPAKNIDISVVYSAALDHHAAEAMHKGLSFVNMPVLDDQFEYHIERREYMKSIEGTEQYDLMKSNKLRFNNLSAAIRCVAYHNYFFNKEMWHILPLAHSMLAILSDNYQEMTKLEKMEFVNQVDAMIIEFLNSL